MSKDLNHEEICQRLKDAQTIILSLYPESEITRNDKNKLYKAWRNLKKVIEAHSNKRGRE